MRWAFDYVVDMGLTDETNYPYSATDTTCTQVARWDDYYISGRKVGSDCDTLLNYMLEKPVSVAVDATSFQHYTSGTLRCTYAQLNHAVLLVGTNKRHWRVKNSWGSEWGENGFATLHRKKNCGICNQFSVPIGLSES